MKFRINDTARDMQLGAIQVRIIDLFCCSGVMGGLGIGLHGFEVHDIKVLIERGSDAALMRAQSMC
jgi:hypothetical protein